MAAPTAVTETYVSCIDSTFTIGTDPDTLVLKVIDGGYTRSMGVAEMTNNGSGGAYEDVKTYKNCKGSFTCAYASGVAPGFKEGDIFAISIANTNGPTLAGNFRFNDVEVPILDIKDGVKYKFTIQNQGAYTVS